MKKIYASQKYPYDVSRLADKSTYNELFNIAKKNIPEMSDLDFRRMIIPIYSKGYNVANLANILLQQIEYDGLDFESTFGFSLLDSKKESIDCNKLMMDMYSKAYADVMSNRYNTNYNAISKHTINMANESPRFYLSKYLESCKEDFNVFVERIDAEAMWDYHYLFKDYISYLLDSKNSIIMFKNPIDDEGIVRLIGLSGSYDLLVSDSSGVYQISKEKYLSYNYYKIKIEQAPQKSNDERNKQLTKRKDIKF